MSDAPKKRMPKQTFTRYVCPVSGRHLDVPQSAVPDGTFEVVEDPEDVLPVGLGRVTLELSAPNPEVARYERRVAKVHAKRAARLQEYLKDLNAQIQLATGDLDEMGLSDEQHAQAEAARAALTDENRANIAEAIAGLQDGSLAREARRDIAADLALPEEPDSLVTRYRCTLNGISTEAMAAIIIALQGAGCPILPINGEGDE